MSKSLILISLEGCGACESIRKQLKKPEIKRVLQEKFGSDEVEEKFADKDALATNIAVSLGEYSFPFIVQYEKKGDKAFVCKLSDSFEVERCAEVVELPKE
jgi:thioredoxin-related protein